MVHVPVEIKSQHRYCIADWLKKLTTYCLSGNLKGVIFQCSRMMEVLLILLHKFPRVQRECADRSSLIGCSFFMVCKAWDIQLVGNLSYVLLYLWLFKVGGFTGPHFDPTLIYPHTTLRAIPYLSLELSQRVHTCECGCVSVFLCGSVCVCVCVCVYVGDAIFVAKRSCFKMGL